MRNRRNNIDYGIRKFSPITKINKSKELLNNLKQKIENKKAR